MYIAYCLSTGELSHCLSYMVNKEITLGLSSAPRRGSAEPRPRGCSGGLAHVLVAGSQAGTTDPSHPPRLRPVFPMFIPVPECSGGRAVVVKRADLGRHWGCGAIEKAGNGKTGRLDRRKGERQTRKGGPV